MTHGTKGRGDIQTECVGMVTDGCLTDQRDNKNQRHVADNHPANEVDCSNLETSRCSNLWEECTRLLAATRCFKSMSWFGYPRPQGFASGKSSDTVEYSGSDWACQSRASETAQKVQACIFMQVQSGIAAGAFL